MIGNKTMMNYLAHRMGIRELTAEDIIALESGRIDKEIVSSSEYFNKLECAKNTEQALRLTRTVKGEK